MNKNFLKFSILIAISLWGSQLMAGSVTVPNTFVSGANASASEVNANFDAIKTAVDDNDTRITKNANDINANSANITAITNAISSIGRVGVFVNGVRVGSLLNFPGSLSPDFSVLLPTDYVTRVKLDGTGLSNASSIDTLFTTSNCTDQAYAQAEMFPPVTALFPGDPIPPPPTPGSGIPVVEAFVPSGQGQLYGTVGGDPIPYRYIPTGTLVETLTYNSKYSGGSCIFESVTAIMYKTFPNDSNVTGVTDAEFIGLLTVSH